MTALSDLLNRSIENRFGKDVSNRELARKSGELSRATIDKYRSGNHGDPTLDILIKFHNLTGAPLVEMRQAAHRLAGESVPWIPPKEADLMSRRQRRAVTELIRSFVARDALSHGDAVVADESQNVATWGRGFRPDAAGEDAAVHRDKESG